jgi:hypothetical protein
MYLFLLAFLTVLKLPSPWRLHWEVRGYTMTLAVEDWIYGSHKTDTYKRIIESLTGNVYWMQVSKSKLDKKLKLQLKAIEDGTLVQDKVYADVQLFLLANRLTYSK